MWYSNNPTPNSPTFETSVKHCGVGPVRYIQLVQGYSYIALPATLVDEIEQNAKSSASLYLGAISRRLINPDNGKFSSSLYLNVLGQDSKTSRHASQIQECGCLSICPKSSFSTIITDRKSHVYPSESSGNAWILSAAPKSSKLVSPSELCRCDNLHNPIAYSTIQDEQDPLSTKSFELLGTIGSKATWHTGYELTPAYAQDGHPKLAFRCDDEPYVIAPPPFLPPVSPKPNQPISPPSPSPAPPPTPPPPSSPPSSPYNARIDTMKSYHVQERQTCLVQQLDTVQSNRQQCTTHFDTIALKKIDSVPCCSISQRLFDAYGKTDPQPCSNARFPVCRGLFDNRGFDYGICFSLASTTRCMDARDCPNHAPVCIDAIPPFVRGSCVATVAKERIDQASLELQQDGTDEVRELHGVDPSIGAEACKNLCNGPCQFVTYDRTRAVCRGHTICDAQSTDRPNVFLYQLMQPSPPPTPPPSPPPPNPPPTPPPSPPPPAPPPPAPPPPSQPPVAPVPYAPFHQLVGPGNKHSWFVAANMCRAYGTRLFVPSDANEVEAMYESTGIRKDDCVWTSVGVTRAQQSLQTTGIYSISPSGSLQSVDGDNTICDKEVQHAKFKPTATNNLNVCYIKSPSNNHNVTAQFADSTNSLNCRVVCDGLLTHENAADGSLQTNDAVYLMPINEMTAQAAVVDDTRKMLISSRMNSLDSKLSLIGWQSEIDGIYNVHPRSPLHSLPVSTESGRRLDEVDATTLHSTIRDLQECSMKPIRKAVMATSKAFCEATRSGTQSAISAARLVFLTVWTLAAEDPRANSCCVPCGDMTELTSCEVVATAASPPSSHPPSPPPHPLYESPPLSKDEIAAEVGRMMDKSCCVRPAHLRHSEDAQGQEHCNRRHCTDHAVTRGIATAGRRTQHRLRNAPKLDVSQLDQKPESSGRRLQELKDARSEHDEDPHKSLSPAMHVVIDMLNDHAYPIDGCDFFYTSASRRFVPKHATRTSAECVIHNVAKRVGDAHGYDSQKIVDTLNHMGSDVTSVLAKLGGLFALQPDRGQTGRAREDPRQVRERVRREQLREIHQEREELERIGRMMQEESDEWEARKQKALEDEHQSRVSLLSEWDRNASALDSISSNETYQGRRLESTTTFPSFQFDRILTSQSVDLVNVDDPNSMLLEQAGRRVEHAESYQSATISHSGRMKRIKLARSFHSVEDHMRQGAMVELIESNENPKDLSASGGALGDGAAGQAMRTFEALSSYAVSSDGSIARTMETIVPALNRAIEDSKKRGGGQAIDTLRAHMRQIDLQSVVTEHSLQHRTRRKLETHTNEQKTFKHHPNMSDTRHHVAMRSLRMLLDGANNSHIRTLANDVSMRRSHERLHDAIVYDIPWHLLIPNMKSLVEADHKRMEWWGKGAHGAPPRSSESSWHDWIGHHVPPSEVGRALRNIGHQMVYKKVPPWDQDGSLGRAMQQNRRREHEVTDLDGTRTWWPTHSLLDGRNRTGGIRRLGESFGKSLASRMLPVPNAKNPQDSDYDWGEFFDALATYLIYNIFLCYLHKPNIDGTDMVLDNGQPVEGHRISHACFPAIPIRLPHLSNFSSIFGIDPIAYADRDPSEFAQWCPDSDLQQAARDAATNIARTLGIELQSAQGRALGSLITHPVHAVMAADSIVRSFFASTSTDRLRLTVCGLSQISAIAYLAALIMLFLAVYLCCFWPCVNILSALVHCFCCVWCGCCGSIVHHLRRRARRRRKMELKRRRLERLGV